MLCTYSYKMEVHKTNTESIASITDTISCYEKNLWDVDQLRTN